MFIHDHWWTEREITITRVSYDLHHGTSSVSYYGYDEEGDYFKLYHTCALNYKSSVKPGDKVVRECGMGDYRSSAPVVVATLWITTVGVIIGWIIIIVVSIGIDWYKRLGD